MADPSVSATTPKLHELDLLKGNRKTVKLIDAVSPIWDKMALRLHFEQFDIDQIKRDHHQQCALACQTMFSEWLKGKGRKPASWNTLIEALREVGESDIESIVADLECILGTILY